MSPSVNRSSDSPQFSGEKPPELVSVPSQHSATPTDDSQNATNSAATADLNGTMPLDVQRQQPIPPPSEPMQYRAIGLVRGQYMPSAEQLTRGTLLATDGTLIDAVLLGRVMSLVKNHLNLDQAHLWVVYPRSRQEDGNLHVQIVGVWEPEKLNKTQSTEPSNSEELLSNSEELPENSQVEASPEESDANATAVVQDGYFSIRGEVIYYSQEEERIIIKIRQSPRKEADKIKFFKLKVNGSLGERVIGHFWDLHVQLQASALVIQEANNIGILPAKKRAQKRPFNNKKRPPNARRNVSNQRPIGKGERPTTATPPKRREPVPKPVKRSENRGGGGNSGNPS